MLVSKSALLVTFILFVNFASISFAKKSKDDKAAAPPLSPAKESPVSISRLPDAENSDSNTETNSTEDRNSTKPAATAPPIPANVTELSETEMAALPVEGSAEAERISSLSIFFVLSVVALCILMIHVRIKAKFEYFPESIIVILIGALVGLLCKIFNTDCKKEEAFSPTAFFLLLLPPIIFESGYNLHKGNFFQNIGSILVFAIFGTFISALVVGGGVYVLGLADVAYPLSFTESFAFGSLISAVDPVATLAIFHALDVDPVLNMLVFGESILNDAVSIVLTTTVLEANTPELADYSTSELVGHGIWRFCVMFFASAFLGVAFGLVSAVLLKHVALRKNLSLELGLMLMFCYAPYVLAEGLHLSGIMAILFCGIAMSHYTHYNLSPVTQITMQQIFRTLALIAENCVFAYLGLAIFSFPHIVKISFIIWSVALILVGRAVNIFPLSWVLNHFRTHKITPQMMAVMWFSGLRGAIAYALSLHLEFDTETRRVIVTTTLIIVLLTIICLGGATMPLMKFIDSKSSRKRTRRKRKRQDSRVILSKTKEIGKAIDSEHLSELTEEEYETKFRETHLSGFALWDVKYFTPFFTRRFTQQDVKESKNQMAKLTEKWYEAIRMSPSNSEDEEEELVQETMN